MAGQTAFDPSPVGPFNCQGSPRCSVHQQADDEVTLLIKLAPDNSCFEGHFPGHPVLAGVVQVDWAIRLGQAAFAIERTFQSVQVLKFKRVVTPDATLHLNLRMNGPDRLYFRYDWAGQEASSGRVHFS